MKRIVGLSACVVSLLAFVTAAHSGGPASNGDFRFELEGVAGAIQFDARTHAGGAARGHVLVTLAGDVSNPDVDGDGTGGRPVSEVTMAAELDCLAIDGNLAVMSGRVVSSSAEGYVHRPALLVVVDNGEGRKAPAGDMFTWGVYPPAANGWVPSDAEREVDPGVGMVWHATDAERKDDVGITVSLSTPAPPVDCTSFPLAAYVLAEIRHGGGNVQVKP
jgi:hypothetical protein